VGSAPRKGFETAVRVKTGESYAGVRAKDASGTTLGTAKAVKLTKAGLSAQRSGKGWIST
jgi:hypothetical protein